MLTVEQSLMIVEGLFDLSLPVQILSIAYVLIMVLSIVRVHMIAFEFRPVLGFVLLLTSPLLVCIYLAMALLYSQLEIKEFLAFVVTHQNPITIGLAALLSIWFITVWNKAHLFWEPLVRMFSLSVLYFIALALLQQFPLFS